MRLWNSSVPLNVMFSYSCRPKWITSDEWPYLHKNRIFNAIQSAENRRKERNQFWLRLHHTVILISNDQTSASKKINLMELIRTPRFLLLRSKERGENSTVFGRLYYINLGTCTVYIMRKDLIPDNLLKLVSHDKTVDLTGVSSCHATLFLYLRQNDLSQRCHITSLIYCFWNHSWDCQSIKQVCCR